MTDNEKLEKLKKLADAMYYAAKYLTTDASRLHKAMEEYHKFIIHECKEEPVSNTIDFEKELYKAFGQVKDFTLGMRIAKHFHELGVNASNPLTWKDMMLIHKCIKDAMNYHLYKMMEGMEGQKVVYQEVLKRFKAQKGE